MCDIAVVELLNTSALNCVSSWGAGGELAVVEDGGVVDFAGELCASGPADVGVVEGDDLVR